MCKKLSYILRHGATSVGLKVRQDGFVRVKDLLGLKDFQSYNLESLQRIVAEDEKKRYKMMMDESGEFYIRANQGHSFGIKDDLMLTRITEPLPTCFHATYQHNMESIKTTGLKVMNRKHIHLSASLDSKSGKRAGCDRLIYIDMKKAMEDGIVFYRSENDVILTSGIDGVLPPRYLFN
jgi:2'-phosphotransferase